MCTKHIITGPKGNSKICFTPRPLMFSMANLRETLKICRGKQNVVFPLGLVFVML